MSITRGYFWFQTKESMLKEAIALRESLHMSKGKCDKLEAEIADLAQVREVRCNKIIAEVVELTQVTQMKCVLFLCLVMLLAAVAWPGSSQVGKSSTRRAKMRKAWGKIRKNDGNLTGKMRKVKLLSTWDCEANYAPDLPLAYVLRIIIYFV